MVVIDKNSIMLVVSDVHLGASRSKSDLFEHFLKDLLEQIENGILSNLKALVILGDFFDLCMDSHGEIANNYKIIYDYLDSIQKKIPVYFTLGNHEIPVMPLLGDFEDLDTKFKKKKIKLIDAFQDKGLNRNFLDDRTICQYFVLRRVDANNGELLLFDSVKQFYDDEIVKLPLSNVNLPINYMCLLTHGHQFHTLGELNAGGVAWLFCIKAPDFIKEIANLIYNDLLKTHKGDVDKITEEEIDEALKYWKSYIKERYGSEVNYFYRQILKEILKYFKKIEEFRENSKGIDYNDRIENYFLPLVLKGASGINKVIFGHTHEMQDETGIGSKIISVNSGCWQLTKGKPNFVEILLDGKCQVKEY